MESTASSLLELVLPFLEEHWVKVLASSLAGIVSLKAIKTLNGRRKTKAKISAHRARIAQATAQLQRRLTVRGSNGNEVLVTKERKHLLECDVTELLEKLKSGEVKPTEVLEAFQARALEVTKETNCVCEFIIEAEEWAKDREAQPASQRGPLYGLPISVKECFFVKGYYATGGLTRFLAAPEKQDGQFVAALKGWGAIPFCVTNVPQTMKSYACSNPVYGLTSHPLDKTRCPGGSSGGETALIAAGGSLVGIGSDVGGSLRIPAHFCGVVGMKPTTGRIYHYGRRKGGEGLLVGIHSNAGIVSQKMDGMNLMMQLMMKNPEAMQRTDTSIAPVPWNELLFSPARKLRIGWYDSIEGLFPVTPACQRAVHKAVDLFKGGGHTAIKFNPPGITQLPRMYLEFMAADNGVNVMPWLKDDIIDQSIEMNMLIWRVPMWLRKNILSHVIKLQSRYLGGLSDVGAHKSSDLWLLMEQLGQVRTDYLNAWSALELDVVIAPGFAFQAPHHTIPSRLAVAATTTGMYNCLDFPVGTLPIIKSNARDEANLLARYPSDDLLFRLVRNTMTGVEGFPAGVQVIGRPWQEEAVLGAMTELETLRDNKGQF